MLVRAMEEVEFPREALVCDGTAAALRGILGKTNNTLITLADEYKSAMSSLKIGTVGIIILLKCLDNRHFSC